ncbi:aminoglycoside phosphotransferase family protein [Phenylobacterium sp.]|uniref:aminoglycoside phosphotransferase family protein n=1 Tax=Phenylobacterium sp. TaxID=1871053 RepID=UPI002F93641B
MSREASRLEIDAELVRRLVADQFPQWADLRISAVEHGGWDNRTFHLGPDMLARLPSAGRYAQQAEKERTWLPRLGPHLPLPIPEPLAIGEPGHGYPYRWSVYRWLPGDNARVAAIPDRTALARDLAAFLRAMHAIDPADGPPPGKHNFFRGGPLETYDAETRDALAALEGRIDTAAARAVWHAALAADWRGAPVWVHGDMAPGNLLIGDGRLSAVIDWGICGVGDPACDLAIAWTFFSGESRAAFRAGLPLDPGAWARARGWTLWKALILAAGSSGDHPDVPASWGVIEDVLAHPL